MIDLKLNSKNIFIYSIGVIFALSASVLSLYNIVGSYYTIGNIKITMLASFFVMFYIFVKTKDTILLYINKNVFPCIFAFAASLIILFKLVPQKEQCFNDLLALDFSSKEWIVFSSFSLTYLLIWLYKKAAEFFKEIAGKLDEKDKKLYLYISAASAILIIISYTSNSGWYTQFDAVYSIDSGYCFRNIFPNALYYDIRHPFLSVFTFPIYAVISFFAEIFVPENITDVFCAISMQIVNIQLLLLGGLLIKILTKSKLVFILYIISFSTMSFILFFEKYQLCVFPVILYAYTLRENHKDSTPSLIAASSVMPTSSFCVIMELFSKDKVKDKLKKLIKIICSGILMLICLGRIHLFTEGINEITAIKNSYASQESTISERFISLTKMLNGSLTALSSTNEGSYVWTRDFIMESLTLMSVLITIIIIIGVIHTWKEHFTKLCAVWLLFSVVLFVGLNWSIHASPLFSVYFAWAIIPMFKNGIDCIMLKCLKLNKKTVYSVLFIMIFIINTITLLDISSFLKNM